MGEPRTASTVLRAFGAAAAGAAVLVALTSCSLFGGTAAPSSSAAPSASAGDVVDPSVPSETPVPSDTATEATPTPSDTESATPTTSATPVDSRKQVVPYITDAEWDAKSKHVYVSGYVPSVLEKGGTCTVTATLGGTTRQQSSAAVNANTYLGCETMTFSGLAAGTWSVRLSYSSAKYAGESAARQVTVG